MSSLEVIFGAASVGTSYTTKEAVLDVAKTLRTVGISRIDTAGRYPPTNPGMSQKLLGEAKIPDEGFTMDTKIWVGSDTGGSLSSSSIDRSIAESLASLGASKVNVLYCHAPDYVTPLEEQVAAFDKHYKLGEFNYLGVSNFKIDMIEDWMAICNEKGYIKPSFYQGQYNLFYRGYEEALFPVLRKYGMRFIAFSPLAGGFLTGKVTLSAQAEDLIGSRFEPGNVVGDGYRRLYDRSEMHQGIESLEKLSKKYNTPMDEAALRWIRYHSILENADGIIIGASRVAQIEANMAAISRGPLPERFADELNELWQIVKSKAPVFV